MNENVDIFVYSHKPFTPLVKNPVYKILTNTKEKIDTKLSVYRDYEGEDNIADKNLMYNEYTGLYWLWRNYPLKKFIGLNHYRRYYQFLDDVPDIEALLDVYSMLLNRPIIFKENNFVLSYTKEVPDNREWYGFWHNVEDFDLLEQLFHEKFPEYLDGFEKMKKAQYLYNSSMFTMPKTMFTEYCEFIFAVLEEYNNIIGCHTVPEYIKHVEDNKEKYIKEHLPYYNVEIQARILGYVAERAMNAYIFNGSESIESKSIYVPWIQI